MQHTSIWMAGVYLMLLMQFLENKVAVELTRSEFVEAQEVGYYAGCPYFVLLSLLLSILATAGGLYSCCGNHWKD